MARCTDARSADGRMSYRPGADPGEFAGANRVGNVFHGRLTHRRGGAGWLGRGLGNFRRSGSLSSNGLFRQAIIRPDQCGGAFARCEATGVCGFGESDSSLGFELAPLDSDIARASFFAEVLRIYVGRFKAPGLLRRPGSRTGLSGQNAAANSVGAVRPDLGAAHLVRGQRRGGDLQRGVFAGWIADRREQREAHRAFRAAEAGARAATFSVSGTARWRDRQRRDVEQTHPAGMADRVFPGFTIRALLRWRPGKKGRAVADQSPATNRNGRSARWRVFAGFAATVGSSNRNRCQNFYRIDQLRH